MSLAPTARQVRKPPPLLGRFLSLAFLTPTLLFVLLFLLIPFIWIIVVSFTDQNLMSSGAPHFVGLNNYQRMFDQQSWLPGGLGHSLVLTVLFVAGSLVGQLGLGLSLAMLFYRRRGWWREVVYTLVTLCWIVPEVPLAFGWMSFLDRDMGMLNAVVRFLHLPAQDWLIDHPMASIIMFNSWRGAAFSMLLFTAALENIPPSFYEVAAVSGAKPWRQFLDVTLPAIKPQFLSGFLLIILWTFNSFGPYLITGGGPFNKTDIISIHTYNVAFKYGDWGLGTAISMLVMVLNLALLGVSSLTSRRVNRATA